MVNFSNPVGQPDPLNKKPSEPTPIQPVEEKRSLQDESSKDFFQQPKHFFKLFILTLLSQAILQFLPKPFANVSLEELVLKLEKALDDFYTSLMELTKKDVSQDTEFLKTLSSHWISLVELSHALEKHKHSLNFPLFIFLQKCNQYPKNQEFSLGYYLSEFAGLKWTPFPYMSILQTLFSEYQTNPELSMLKKWLKELESLKEKLNNSFPC